ncbi:hypothetical protein ACLKMH_14130 [Psychromonas sp. KJ10-10]|uniref:hypothetical protein n=1 Tax=Psychromonas sp. KJ10-10 TaxID=3391823 RepID=UPI0039B627F0
MKRNLILTSVALLLTSQFTFANQQGPSGNPGPPPEATTACEDKSEGDSAEFEGRDGEIITGTCEDRNGTLILRPDNPPQH